MVEIRADSFFNADPKQRKSAHERSPAWRAPPRLLSDQLVNIFFQEWAPIFPVLHRPTFLHLYEDFTAAPESMSDKKSLAQLHLVFAIAAQSNNVCRRRFHTIPMLTCLSHTTLRSSPQLIDNGELHSTRSS